MNMATMNSHEQLYEKLNNVHASLRKEKEDAYRSKQLAEQRLQLARSDREAAERKGSETVTQLRQLKEKAIEMKKVNAIVEAEIRLMEKEYNFQHSELQGKKEKLTRLEEIRTLDAEKRQYSITGARDMLRRLRENKKDGRGTSSTYTTLSTEAKRDKLKQMLESGDEAGGERLLMNLPVVMNIRAEVKGREVEELEMRSASLMRIIAGYQNALGEEPTMMEAMHQENLNGMNIDSESNPME